MVLDRGSSDSRTEWEIRDETEIGKFIGILLVAEIRPEDYRDLGVAVERAYVGRNIGTALTIALRTGMLVGGLPLQCRERVEFVRAATWRKRLLGMKITTGREDAKRETENTVRELAGSGVVDRWLGPEERGREDAIDAIGIALFSLCPYNR